MAARREAKALLHRGGDASLEPRARGILALLDIIVEALRCCTWLRGFGLVVRKLFQLRGAAVPGGLQMTLGGTAGDLAVRSCDACRRRRPCALASAPSSMPHSL